MPTWLVLGPAIWIAFSLFLVALAFIAYIREERRESSKPPCRVFDMDDYRDRASWR